MTALPTGITVRPFRIDTDVPPLLQLLTEVEAIDNSGELLSKEQVQSLPYRYRRHDPETDRWVIETSLKTQTHLSLTRRFSFRVTRMTAGSLTEHSSFIHSGGGKGWEVSFFQRLKRDLHNLT